MTVGEGVGAPSRTDLMRVMLLEARGAEAVAALRAAGILAVLLKGPVTALWLYPGTGRVFNDVDLLVDPDCLEKAAEVLGTLGYRHNLAGAHPTEFSRTEIELLGPDAVCIDLHRTLLGVRAEPSRAWAVLSKRLSEQELHGTRVPVLDEVARTLHLALHVAQSGVADTKAVRDLGTGLARLSPALWAAAAQLASEIDADAAFTAGLRTLPAGSAVADELGLPQVRDVELILRTGSAPAWALRIEEFRNARGLVGRARYVRRKLWPTAAYLNWERSGTPLSEADLNRARVLRLAGLPYKAVVAVVAWAAARRRARS